MADTPTANIVVISLASATSFRRDHQKEMAMKRNHMLTNVTLADNFRGIGPPSSAPIVRLLTHRIKSATHAHTKNTVTLKARSPALTTNAIVFPSVRSLAISGYLAAQSISHGITAQ
jgi:hypothetical protein